MIVCTRCGTESPDGATWCEGPDCGAFLPHWGRREDGGGEHEPDASFKVLVEPGSLAAPAGTPVVCNVRVRNTGARADRFSVDVYGDAAPWAVVEDPELDVEAGDEGVTRVVLRPPAETASGAVTTAVGVTSARNGELFVLKEVELAVTHESPPTGGRRAARLALTLQEGQRLEPGGEVLLRADVRNTGDLVDEIELVPVGPLAAWADRSPALTLRLIAGDAGSAVVRVAPPRGAEPRAGPTEVRVRAVSAVNGEVLTEQSVPVEVLPLTAVSAALKPEAARDRFCTSHVVHLRNTGNHGLEDLPVAVTGKDDSLRFRVWPETPTVPWRGEGVVFVEARAARRHLIGAPRRDQPFRITVGDPDAPLAELRGSMTQVALLPVWVLLALLALVPLSAWLLGQVDDPGLVLLAAVVGAFLVVVATVTGALGRLLAPGRNRIGGMRTIGAGAIGVASGVLGGLLGQAVGVGWGLSLPAALLGATLTVVGLTARQQRRGGTPRRGGRPPPGPPRVARPSR